MLRRIRRALISVSDKSGLVELARVLAGFGVELISTGGTFRALKDAGLVVREVSEITSFPEMLDGRVKTLHPSIHGGILFIRDQPEHEATIAKHGIGPIDLVVVNLYPFEATVAKAGVAWQEAIENIDIGGPSLIRGAAKNHDGVAVLTDVAQYDVLIEELKNQQGATTLEFRARLAAEAYARTAAYDAAIAEYFARCGHAETWPKHMVHGWSKKLELRYGENPHQVAAFYAEPNAPNGTIAAAEQLHGKELSYNNILDLDAAWRLVGEFIQPAAVVIKHNNPCGAATAESLALAFAAAHAGDPVSAFGGILAFNRPVDAATAELIASPNRFVEAIIAPEYDPAALEILTTRPTWKKNVRLLRTGAVDRDSTGYDLRRVGGGLLVQSWDVGADQPSNWQVASKRQPTAEERQGLAFAWKVCKHVKSNAIVLAQGSQVVGVGAGQMSRIDSTDIAVKKAGDRVAGSVLASDAFFPFRDNVDAAARAGIRAIIQPGGSMRDADSILACDEHDIAMIMTGVRHFRH